MKKPPLFIFLILANLVFNSIVIAQKDSVQNRPIASDSVRSYPDAVSVVKEIKLDYGINFRFHSSPLEILSGRISGLHVQSVANYAGADVSLISRGATSLRWLQPVIAIDGIPIYGDEEFGNEMKNLNSLDASEVYSIEVLRDASAYAQFGQLGRSGAILIETKQRTPKPFQLEFTSIVGISSLPKMQSVYSGDEYRKLVVEHFANNSSIINMLGSANTNWQKEIYQKAALTNNNLNIAGHLGIFPYRFSAGYLNEGGAVKTTGFKRKNLAFSTNPVFFVGRLAIRFNVRYSDSENKLAPNNVINNAIISNPTFPVMENGEYTTYESLSYVLNPVALLNQSSDILKADRLMWDTKINLQLFKSLHLKITYSQTKLNNNETYQVQTDAIWLQTYSLLQESNKYKGTQKWMDFSLNFDKTFAKKHTLKADVGYSNLNYKKETSFVEKYKMREDNTGYFNSMAKYYSAYSNAKYIYNEKYGIETTFRLNSESIYTNGFQFTKTAYVGAFWEIAKENFLKNNDWISKLKLRINYGQTGSNFSKKEKDETDLQPEQIEQMNIGLQSAFFYDKIWFDIDFYKKNGKYLWGEYQMNYNANQGAYFDVMTSTNSGIEISMGTTYNRHDVYFTLSGNFSYNKNSLDKFPLNYYSNSYFGQGFNFEEERYRNQAYSQFYLKQIDSENGKPLEEPYGYSATNKTVEPKIMAGINAELQYKNWVFTFTGSANFGNYVFDRLEEDACYYAINNLQNTSTILSETQFNYSAYLSGYFLHKASFFRMDYIGFSYIWKPKNTKLETEFSLFAQNAFVLSTYKGVDPDIYKGVNYSQYPRTRIFGLGVSLRI